MILNDPQRDFKLSHGYPNWLIPKAVQKCEILIVSSNGTCHCGWELRTVFQKTNIIE